MFDLEKSIADRRKQMLAAGIKTPVPLEELEIHLREEIERLMKSGLNEQEAFEIAVQQIGKASLLEAEFEKDNHTKHMTRKFIFTALWMAGFATVTFIVWIFMLDHLASARIVSLPFLLYADLAFKFVFFLSPLVAFFFGLHGLLPGTKPKEKAHKVSEL
jgi:hypothetical protein